MAVHSYILGDWMISQQDHITQILNSGLHVLVYSGDQDWICNWRGGEKWTHEAKWSRSTEFQNATYSDWKVANMTAAAGEVK